ncbi:aldo/keto reductase [Alteromonas sp. 14N.309.X.WAT.G.H12]|uniref:aldo/keto reductase n=1 Tax=Alteromonas sp. 14N.309.X.WAT.G.H12 TaxID=3120824 RepID=UPI002FD43052
MQKYFPQASRMIYGCMGLGGGWNTQPVAHQDVQQAHRVIEQVLSLDINVFDHADIYTFGKAETVFGRVLKDNPSLRDKLVIQSKCGIRFADESGPKRYDFSAKWIERSVEGILTRLNIEQLDILLLHRPDPLMALEEVANTLARLQQQGKITHVGVSNMHGHQIAYLQSALSTPVVVNQLEMSLACRDWLEDGITTNSKANCSSGYGSGTLEYCLLNNVQVQAWGCLAQGIYTGAKNQNNADAATANLVNQLASDYETSPEAIVLAWLMRHPANIQPVLGSTNLQRIKHCEAAMRVTLSREHWYLLLETARGHEIP